MYTVKGHFKVDETSVQVGIPLYGLLQDVP